MKMWNRIPNRTAVAVLTLLAPAALLAGEWDATGFAELNSRTFPNDNGPADSRPGSTSSLAVQPEIYWRGDDGRLRFSGVGFGRLDSDDDQRSHLDLREANVGVSGNGWDLNTGINKVFWGVTESRHLVDVINQTDLVEDPDEEDKLGQPMINLNLDRDFGRFEIYILPRFRERTFVADDGRLGTPLPVAKDDSIYESTDGKRHTDVSLRYSHYFGDLDFAAYVFDGTSREPRFEFDPVTDTLRPVYEQMQQAGIEAQLTRDAWLWKLEAIVRNTTTDDFTAAVAGVEYTFFGIHQSAADVGFLVEYLNDGRNGNAPPTIFDDDVFVGARLALNDPGDTSILAGVVVDTETHESLLSIEASRRFREHYTLDARLRFFMSAAPGDATWQFANDDYLEVSVSRYY